MEHYSVHLDQYISLTSSSSGNFLSPWNIFSAAVLLINHSVKPKQAPGSGVSGPGSVTDLRCHLASPRVAGDRGWFALGLQQGQVGWTLLPDWTPFLQELDKSSVIPPASSAQHHCCALRALLSQLRGPSLTPSTSRISTELSFWALCKLRQMQHGHREVL